MLGDDELSSLVGLPVENSKVMPIDRVIHVAWSSPTALAATKLVSVALPRQGKGGEAGVDAVPGEPPCD